MTAAPTADGWAPALADDARLIAREVDELVAGLSETQLAWTPAPGAWGIAHCLEHLAVTNAQYRPRLERAIAGARGGSPGAAYRPTLTGRLMLRALGPASRRRLRAPKVFRPVPQPPPGAAERFHAEQRALIALIQRAGGVDVNRAKLSSPVSPLIRLSVGDALHVAVVHERRHLAQARRVRERPDFPRRDAAGRAP